MSDMRISQCFIQRGSQRGRGSLEDYDELPGEKISITHWNMCNLTRGCIQLPDVN
jgi:hypothetical protein